MPHELTTAEKTRKLPWALGGDAASVVYLYLAFGGPIFLLFLDRLGLDKGQIGVLLAIFPFCGLVALVSGPVSAHVGFKRVFVTFWGVRHVVLAGVLAAPWVVNTYGVSTGFIFVASVLTVFSLFRAIAESAYTPWCCEWLPPPIRGKFTAAATIVAAGGGAITVALAGWGLGAAPDANRFLLLFMIAFFFGMASTFCYAQLPPSAPRHDTGMGSLSLGQIFAPFKDRRYVAFLVAGALVSFGWGPMTAFLPLFFKDQIGLNTRQVVLLDASVLLSTLGSSFLWGWTADRYGGKPVMLFNLVTLLLYPIGLLLIPRHSAYSNLITLGLNFVIGVALAGWNIGYSRYFFVDLIPSGQHTMYTSVHTAWHAVVGGSVPLIAGVVLSLTHGWIGRAGVFYIDPYTPLFISCIVGVSVSVWMISVMPAHGGMAATRFAAMFVQGNPIGALQALIAYEWAGHENKRISTIEWLGQTRSPLSIQELVDALSDPSFNVRFEAAISIARTRPDPRLTDAIIKVLREGDPELRPTAAWALGRMGDRRAIEALRESLGSPYDLLRARSARALGILGDHASAPRLQTLFEEEQDPLIRVAYTSALAAIGGDAALPSILAFLQGLENPGHRREVSLGVATMLGGGTQALRLWRRMHDQPGDTLGGVMLGLRRRLVPVRDSKTSGDGLPAAIDRCTRAFGSHDLAAAAQELQTVGIHVRTEVFTPTANLVLAHTLTALERHGAERPEYLFLAVHTLHVGLLPEP